MKPEEIIQASSFNTSCEKCVFRINTLSHQHGCQADRLNKFENIEYIPKRYNSYYVIKGRICNYCRQSDWALQQQTDLLTAIKQETAIKYSVVIDGKDRHINDIIKTFDSISKQNIKPKLITIVVDKDLETYELAQYLKNFNFTTWKITKDYTEKTFNRYISEALNKNKSIYYLICKAGDIISINFINEANDTINEKLERLLFSKDTNALLIQSYLYWLISEEFNSIQQLVNNIEKLCKEY